MPWPERIMILRANLGRTPTLEEALAEAAGYKMTQKEKRAQRRSWVVGELMLEHPEMTREEAERRVDEVMAYD